VDTVVHFPPSLEEVTLTVSDERMWVRNHVEDEAGDRTPTHTLRVKQANRQKFQMIFLFYTAASHSTETFIVVQENDRIHE